MTRPDHSHLLLAQLRLATTCAASGTLHGELGLGTLTDKAVLKLLKGSEDVENKLPAAQGFTTLL